MNSNYSESKEEKDMTGGGIPLPQLIKKTKEEKPFYIEFFLCNPKLAKDRPTFGQLKENKEKGIKPSYLMVNVGYEYGEFDRNN
jgi:hypothetical protein